MDLMADYITAQGLMDEVRMKSPNYETAIARCVDGMLHRHGYGLENGDLYQECVLGGCGAVGEGPGEFVGHEGRDDL